MAVETEYAQIDDGSLGNNQGADFGKTLNERTDQEI
jgi:hypothetical protein